MKWKTKTGIEININQMTTSHLANCLYALAGKYNLELLEIGKDKADIIGEMIDEFEKRVDIKPQDFNKYANAVSILEKESNMSQTYNIRINSPFILTPNQVKNKLGIGYKVLEVMAEKDINNQEPITDVDSAMSHIILAGYRALARAYHPDLGGDPEVMIILNRTKKELLDLLKEIKG
jgi:hypothetical protein